MRPTTCRHWRGTVNETCEVDVNWSQFTGGDMVGVIKKIPCCNPDLQHLCDLHELPTAKEIAEEERLAEEALERFKRELPYWAALKEKHPKGGSGITECPRCKGRCQWSIAECNNHLWVRCETENCVAFME